MDELSQAAEQISKVQVAEAPPEQNPPPPTEDAGPERPAGEQELDSAPPTIDPPASWDDEGKTFFQSLPREAQEQILKRERDRDGWLRRSQDEAAKTRKEIEAQRERAVTEAQQYVQHVQTAAQALHQSLLHDFPDVKTAADLYRLSTEDPGRYLQYDARMKQVQQAYQMIEGQQRQAQHLQQQKMQEWAKAEQEKLADLVPEWKDKGKRDAEIQVIKDYAVEQGLTRQEAEQPWSASAVVMARKAMLFDRAQRSAAKAKVANLPKVVRPGSAPEAGEAERVRSEEARKRLNKSGALDDAALAIAGMRSAQR